MLSENFINLELLNLASIAPMVLLTLFGLGILVVSMVKSSLSSKFYSSLTLIALVLSFGLIVGYGGASRGLFGLVLMDGFAIIMIGLLLLVSMFFILYNFDGSIGEEYDRPEFYALFLLMIVGYAFMIASDSLVVVVIGLELSSLVLYTLIAMKNDEQSLSAAIKYFVMGAVASGFFIFGIAIIYLVTKSFEVAEISDTLAFSILSLMDGTSGAINSVTLCAGVVFVLVGLGFKVSMVPFHTWLSDIYSGSRATLAAYISIAPKVAAFVVALRVFNSLLNLDMEFLKISLFFIAVITMTLANLVALVQESLKRVLAFSSISHAGFIMAAIMIGSSDASVAMVLYWVMFCAANLGIFGIVLAFESKKEDENITFDSLKGLVRKSPFLATLLGIFAFSLAGVPPFSLFWGKMYLFSSAIAAGEIALAIIMALNSAVAMYYYLKIVVFGLLRDGEPKFSLNLSLKVSLILAAFACLISPFIVKFLLPKIYLYMIFSGF